MRICVLGSGSKGNATYIESGDTSVLIDNGFSGKEAEKRLASIGASMDRVSAILVTHEHTDHIRGVPVLSRRWKLPVYANQATVLAAKKNLAKLHDFQEFNTGENFFIDHLTIHPFAISHDAADPVGFLINNGKFQVGYCTDTGMVSRLMQHRLTGCHCLILESNHDPILLKNGPYPPMLQQRVRSNIGHLDNQTAATFLAELFHKKLRHVFLAHLSDTNNRPEEALKTTREAIQNLSRCNGQSISSLISVAPQDRNSKCIVLEE